MLLQSALVSAPVTSDVVCLYFGCVALWFWVCLCCGWSFLGSALLWPPHVWVWVPGPPFAGFGYVAVSLCCGWVFWFVLGCCPAGFLLLGLAVGVFRHCCFLLSFAIACLPLPAFPSYIMLLLGWFFVFFIASAAVLLLQLLLLCCVELVVVAHFSPAHAVGFYFG